MLLHQKKLYASPSDRDTYNLFTEAGVLSPHHPHKVEGKQLCSHCADGFRPHYKAWVAQLCLENGGKEAFLHNFSGNGDPMRFAYQSPLSDGSPAAWGEMKILEIVETLGWADDLKISVNQMCSAHHWPCKAALSRNIDLAQSIDLVLRGKLRIKQQIPDLKVATIIFIDWSEEHSENLIKKGKYLDLIRTDPKFSATYDAWQKYENTVRTLPVLRLSKTQMRASA